MLALPLLIKEGVGYRNLHQLLILWTGFPLVILLFLFFSKLSIKEIVKILSPPLFIFSILILWLFFGIARSIYFKSGLEVSTNKAKFVYLPKTDVPIGIELDIEYSAPFVLDGEVWSALISLEEPSQQLLVDYLSACTNKPCLREKNNAYGNTIKQLDRQGNFNFTVYPSSIVELDFKNNYICIVPDNTKELLISKFNLIVPFIPSNGIPINIVDMQEDKKLIEFNRSLTAESLSGIFNAATVNNLLASGYILQNNRDYTPREASCFQGLKQNLLK
ncbi:hypothetical protein [Dasania marina]|uniref:hypothetical protein n=1 Tax=Dasania marina TaxID=471499 RepID=UPI0012EACD77|nr:hypothetical protein [Dasania marina]